MNGDASKKVGAITALNHGGPWGLGMANAAVRLKFWGVRGSIPVPERDYLAYGGNTTCVEIRAGKSIIIIDAGTGIRGLGMSLQEEFAGSKLDLHVLLTHFHWDHIQGLPFFAPLYSAEHEIKFYSAHDVGQASVSSGRRDVYALLPSRLRPATGKEEFCQPDKAWAPAYRRYGVPICHESSPRSYWISHRNRWRGDYSRQRS